MKQDPNKPTLISADVLRNDQEAERWKRINAILEEYCIVWATICDKLRSMSQQPNTISVSFRDCLGGISDVNVIEAFSEKLRAAGYQVLVAPYGNPAGAFLRYEMHVDWSGAHE